VSKFGAIFFTPIRFYAVVCCASGLWKGMLCFRKQNVHPPPPRPPHKHRYRRRQLVTAHFFSSWLARCTHWVLLLPLALEFAVCWNIDTGLWNKHSSLTMKIVSGVLYPYTSDKTNAQNSEMSRKINVYSYRRAYRRASYSVGVICRDCGVVTFNTQSSIY
jgi:hypothetical protein